MSLDKRLRAIAAQTADEIVTAIRTTKFSELGVGRRSAKRSGTALDYTRAKAAAIAEFERTYCAALMAEHGGNVRRAAKAAGISNVSLYRILDRHGLR